MNFKLSYLIFNLFLFFSFSLLQSEINTLYQFYSQTNYLYWSWKSTGPKWNFNLLYPNPCSTNKQYWQGITCSKPPLLCLNYTLCHIIYINLDYYNITGPILTNWSGLNYLIDLSLSLNKLTGYIPLYYPNKLKILKLNSNYLKGNIPFNISKLLPIVSIIQIQSNLLTGNIPSSIGDIITLSTLYLFNNKLNGTIPLTIGKLTNLEILYLYNNLLSGPIPSTFGLMKSLSFAILDVNKLTDTIPSSIGLLSSLIFLDLDLNYLTGSIPSTISLLTRIETFTVDTNLLSSSIPCNLHLLSVLTYFDIDFNYFTSFCSDLIFPSSLEMIDLAHNYFHTSIPSPLITNLSQLQLLDIQYNFFSSSLPHGLEVMTRLYYLGGGNNRFTGKLPTGLSKMFYLDQLYLENNHLTGSLNSLVSNPNQMDVYIIDLSNNKLSGQIPNQLFLLPKLNTLALTANCFHGTIPHSICYGKQLSVLSLDGLGAAKGCSFQDTFLSQKFHYRNSMGGDIPLCLWNMKNLSILSLSGNALGGKIHSIPFDSQLINLTLSHNHLSGTIPKSILLHNYNSLDLSYNKFTGEYSSPSNHTNRIILEVNRLSGQLHKHLYEDSLSLSSSSSLSLNIYLNILNGNIFGCKYLPNNDIDSSSYRCGSQIFDYSMICFAILFIIIIIFICSFYFIVSSNSFNLPIFLHNQLSKISNQWNLILYYISISPILQLNLPEIGTSYLVLIYMQRTAVYVFITCIITTIPLYILRFIDGSYSTHTHLYRWVWTTAYFSGIIPSLLQLMSWIFVVLFFFYRMFQLKNENYHTTLLNSNLSINNSNTNSLRSFSTIGFENIWSGSITIEGILLVLINIGVIGTVNAFYIIASTNKNISSSELFTIQISFALFKTFWNKLCLPILNITKHSYRIKIIISILNSIFIPSIVIAMTSPSCFQSLIIEPEQIQTTYTSSICLAVLIANETIYCVGDKATRVQVLPYTPPLSYNYLCGSTLLSTYLPVYCYMYTLQILISPLIIYILINYIPYNKLPLWAKSIFSSLYWPNQALSYSSSSSSISIQENKSENNHDNEEYNQKNNISLKLLFVRHGLIIKYIEDILNLITFGLYCPLLGLAITLSITLSTVMTRYSIGRFVDIRLKLNQINSNLSCELNTNTNINTNPNNSLQFQSQVISPISQSTTFSRGDSSITRPFSSTFSSSLYDPTLIHLNHILSDLHSSYYQLIWIVLCSSCFFVSFLIWDTASDKVGPINSIWMPLLCITTVISLKILERYLRYLKRNTNNLNNTKELENKGITQRESKEESKDRRGSDSNRLLQRETEIIPLNQLNSI